MTPGGLVASVRQRLLNLSRGSGEVFDSVLGRYGVERFLYRLSVSECADRFVLKGAMLFHVWRRHMHRPTRDVHLLGAGLDDVASVREAVAGVMAVAVPDDGLRFDTGSLSVDTIHDDDVYGGMRAKMVARLGNVRIPVQVDVGFGDKVVPAPARLEFPALLEGFPAALLATYQPATVIAEKFEALVRLDEPNSRMKDFFDLRLLLAGEGLDRGQLMRAIRSTFKSRRTPLPADIPTGLTDGFAARKATMWQAFLRKNGLLGQAPGFAVVVGEIRDGLRGVWEHDER